jgi:hypothetical protein
MTPIHMNARVRAEEAVRVLIGTPTFEYHQHCVIEFITALKRQSEQRFDLMLVDNSPTPHHANRLRKWGLPVFRSPFTVCMRERMTMSRNIIRNMLLEGAYTHLLFLDQDVVLPPYGLEHLLSHRVPIVSGVYCKAHENEIYAMVILQESALPEFQINVTPLSRLGNRGVRPVDAAGFGCLLVERDVSERIPFRYERFGNSDADRVFSADARRLGYSILCDTNVHCEHRYIERDFDRHPEWGEW